VRLYDYAWFVGFIIAFVVYLALRWIDSRQSQEQLEILPT